MGGAIRPVCWSVTDRAKNWHRQMLARVLGERPGCVLRACQGWAGLALQAGTQQILCWQRLRWRLGRRRWGGGRCPTLCHPGGSEGGSGRAVGTALSYPELPGHHPRGFLQPQFLLASNLANSASVISSEKFTEEPARWIGPATRPLMTSDVG